MQTLTFDVVNAMFWVIKNVKKDDKVINISSYLRKVGQKKLVPNVWVLLMK